MPILSLLFLVVVIPWLNLVPQICFELGESELAILVAVAIPANDTFDVIGWVLLEFDETGPFFWPAGQACSEWQGRALEEFRTGEEVVAVFICEVERISRRADPL
eukprot:3898470-Pyramimonas_sp.AAC.1